MALIICPECGKEISDRAPACINCGCPVSEMKAAPAKPAAPARPAAPAQSATPAGGFSNCDINGKNLGNIIGGFFAGYGTAPKKPAVKPIPAEIPEMKLLPGVICQLVEKGCGVVGMAGFLALGNLVVALLNGGAFDMEMLALGILCIAGNQLLAWVSQWIEYRHVRKYLRKNGYEDSIRYDSPNFVNSVAAFQLSSDWFMVGYIKKLNPAAGSALKDALKKNRAENRKKWLKNLPYIVILVAIYYLLPRYEFELFNRFGDSLIACHVATLVIMTIFGYKREGSFSVALLLGVLFAPVIYAYFFSEWWYHIVICGVAAFVGMLLGTKIYRAKHK